MSKVFHDKQRAGEHLVSEVDINMSRKTITLVAGKVYKPGSVIAKVTASGDYDLFDPAGADGTETVAGILYAEVDATDAIAPGVMHYQLAVVKPTRLNWKTGITDPQKAAAMAVLAQVHITEALMIN